LFFSHPGAFAATQAYNRAMKPVSLVAGLLLASRLFAVASPGDDIASSPQAVVKEPALQFSWADANDPALAPYRRAGDFVVDSVIGRLCDELESLPTARHPETVISRVHMKNYTVPVSPWGSPRAVSVKRTSLRVRDPQNAPDAAERAVLEFYQKAFASGGAVPEMLVQNVTPPGQPPEVRIYRPLSTRPLCLVCHGPVKRLSPGVRQALEHLYPQDAAVDYAANEWRGLVRVSFEAPSAGKKE
jgi:hypothetical protein